MNKVKETKLHNPRHFLFIAIWMVVGTYKFLFSPPPVVRKILLDIFNQYPLTSTIYQGLQFIFGGVPIVLLVVYLALRFFTSFFDSIYFKL